MTNRLAIYSLLVLGLTAGQAAAQSTLYVSNFTGGQVLAVNSSTGATTVLFSGAQINQPSFRPQDMTVGPDGNLYVCDSLSSRVWRFTVGQPVAASVNPVVVAQFAAGVYPEGPAFSGSDDLYLNTRGFGTAATDGFGATGVWVIPGVATPGAQLPIPPQQVLGPIGEAGAGTTFAAPGHLLAVDTSGNRVVAADPHRGAFPHYGPSFVPLITSNLSAPVGIATSACGDVLVSSGNAIRRFSTIKDITTGALSARFENTYVTFPRGDVVTFIERNAANVLFVNTNSATAGGKVWRIAPALGPGGDPISSCTSGVLPAAPLVTLKTLSQGQNAPLNNSQLQAVGLAIPPSSFTAPAKTFSPASPSQSWNFGHYSIRIDYKQVFQPFSLSVTALMSNPYGIDFVGAFGFGTEPMRLPSLGGFASEFRTVSNPATLAGHFAPSGSDGPGYRVFLFYNDPIQGFRNPGVAHAPGDSSDYVDDYTLDTWVGEDGIRAGGGDSGSSFVGFDEPFQPGLALPLSVTVNQPALDGNPLFKLGQNLTFAITVKDANGQPVPGLTIRLSALRFRPTPFVFEFVRATAGGDNVLVDNGNGRYSIGVKTNFQGGPGVYQFTLFGTGFAPFAFYAQFER